MSCHVYNLIVSLHLRFVTCETRQVKMEKNNSCPEQEGLSKNVWRFRNLLLFGRACVSACVLCECVCVCVVCVGGEQEKNMQTATVCGLDVWIFQRLLLFASVQVNHSRTVREACYCRPRLIRPRLVRRPA